MSLFLGDNSTGNAAIGMNEKQGLTCAISAGSNTSAYLEIEFMGESAMIKANATISDLRYGEVMLIFVLVHHEIGSRAPCLSDSRSCFCRKQSTNQARVNAIDASSE